MTKLYPPVIQGTIPANCGEIIKIPYEMNKAVGYREIYGFSLKIKSIQSNIFIGEISTTFYNSSDNIAIFSKGNIELEEGVFYKVQLAYLMVDGNPGYYSTVGVMKYISEPILTLENSASGVYIGTYSQKVHTDSKYDDSTEKVYSYNFTLMDSKGNVLETSGEQLHNSDNDTDLFESIDEFVITKELTKGEAYRLTYSIKTINGLEQSISKKIYKADSIDSKLKTKITTSLNYDNGYVDINLTNPNPDETEEPTVGSFMLLRASDEDNYSTWNEVLKFALYGQKPSRHLWRDFTIKQGVNYKYAIQQYNNNGLRSNKIESDIIYADFEDAFLYDGIRQLKIKFNPKLSSFKNTLLENKVDTIGSKYPFIFRNGNVNYKQFPISGLISYLSDEEELFYDLGLESDEMPRQYSYNYKEVTISAREKLTWANKGYTRLYYYNKNTKTYQKLFEEVYQGNYDLFYSKWVENNSLGYVYYLKVAEPFTTFDIEEKNIKTTNLTSDNITNERNFKLEVLDWLTNGEPKLFRSPAEGNYLVRLLNVSLSPEDKLNRMLHTFSCTAYEIAEYSYKALNNYGIITTEVPDKKQLRWQTIDLSGADIKASSNILTYSPAAAVKFEGMRAGDKFTIVWTSGETQSIVIGVTGSYIVDLASEVEIASIVLDGSFNPTNYQGTLTYAYYSSEFKDSFDTVQGISVMQTPVRQFVGKYENILDKINDIKNELESIGKLKVYLRNNDTELWEKDEKLYKDSTFAKEFNGLGFIDIYSVNKEDGSQTYYDPIDGEYKDITHEDTSVYINGEQIDLWDIYSYEVRLPEDISSIKPGAAVICEVTYQSKTIAYDVEENNKEVIAARQAYISEKANTDLNTLEKILAHEAKLQGLYSAYIEVLQKAIEEEERR